MRDGHRGVVPPDAHWITIDGDMYESDQGLTFFKRSYVKSVAKKLRERNPNSEVKLWYGWKVGV